MLCTVSSIESRNDEEKGKRKEKIWREKGRNQGGEKKCKQKGKNGLSTCRAYEKQNFVKIKQNVPYLRSAGLLVKVTDLSVST